MANEGLRTTRTEIQVARSKAGLSIRIDLAHGRFGPGKAALLRAIGDSGSISAAARSLGMSYARAWHLTENMNSMFRDRVVDTFAGGNRRGGATLTPAGRRVLALYESITATATRAVAKKLDTLETLGE